MKRTIISVMLVLVIVIGCAANASAICNSEDYRPAIIGMEHQNAIMKLYEAWWNGEIEIPYNVEMTQVGGYWVVRLIEDVYEDYVAYGIYDHCPTEEEFEILWANRMLEDEMYDLLEELGF